MRSVCDNICVADSDLGRLLIVWGTGAGGSVDRRSVMDFLKTDVWFGDFHADAMLDYTDPFLSRYFGWAVKELLDGRTVALADSVFDDEGRRRVVERAFRRTLPGLHVEHVLLGNPATTTAGGGSGGISFDGDVYEESTTGWNEAITVECDDPQERLVPALTEAAARMLRVDETGQEWVVPINGLDLDTPNGVSDVTSERPGRASFYVDCKGAVGRARAERFREILTAELQRNGIFIARVSAWL